MSGQGRTRIGGIKGTVVQHEQKDRKQTSDILADQFDYRHRFDGGNTGQPRRRYLAREDDTGYAGVDAWFGL